MKFKKIVLTSLFTISALTISNVLNQQTIIANKGLETVDQKLSYEFYIDPNSTKISKLGKNHVQVEMVIEASDQAKCICQKNYFDFKNKHLYLITSQSPYENENMTEINSSHLSIRCAEGLVFVTATFDLDTLKKIKDDKNCTLLITDGNTYIRPNFHHTANYILQEIKNKTFTVMNLDDKGREVIDPKLSYEFYIDPNSTKINKLDEKNVQVEMVIEASDQAKCICQKNYFDFQNKHLYFITSQSPYENENMTEINSSHLSIHCAEGLVFVTATFDLDTLKKIKDDKNCTLLITDGNTYIMPNFHQTANYILQKVEKDVNTNNNNSPAFSFIHLSNTPYNYPFKQPKDKPASKFFYYGANLRYCGKIEQPDPDYLFEIDLETPPNLTYREKITAADFDKRFTQKLIKEEKNETSENSVKEKQMKLWEKLKRDTCQYYNLISRDDLLNENDIKNFSLHVKMAFEPNLGCTKDTYSYDTYVETKSVTLDDNGVVTKAVLGFSISRSQLLQMLKYHFKKGEQNTLCAMTLYKNKDENNLTTSNYLSSDGLMKLIGLNDKNIQN